MGISAEIEFSNCVANNLAGSCEEMPIIEEHMSPHDEVNEEIESRQPVIKTSPEVNLKL